MTEYKLVVVGGKTGFVYLEVMETGLLIEHSLLIPSWRCWQECLDNSTNSESVSEGFFPKVY